MGRPFIIQSDSESDSDEESVMTPPPSYESVINGDFDAMNISSESESSDEEEFVLYLPTPYASDNEDLAIPRQSLRDYINSLHAEPSPREAPYIPAYRQKFKGAPSITRNEASRLGRWFPGDYTIIDDRKKIKNR